MCTRITDCMYLVKFQLFRYSNINFFHIADKKDIAMSVFYNIVQPYKIVRFVRLFMKFM